MTIAIIILVAVVFLLDYALATLAGVQKFGRLRPVSFIYTCALAAAGLIGAVALRVNLYFSLKAKPFSDESFGSFLMYKYDSYARIVLILTAVLLVALLLLQALKGDGFISRKLSLILPAASVANIVAGFIYGWGTINKEFDLASYILLLAVCASAMLHAAYLPKRKVKS